VNCVSGPDLKLSCPGSVTQGSTFDCVAGWGAIPPGGEPYAYQLVIAYDSPAAASGTPLGSGTGMTLTAIARQYTAAAMWGPEFCPANTLNAANPLLPTGYVLAYAACVSLGGPGLQSPHDLIKFTFTANGTGTFPVHMITVSQGGEALGSFTYDAQSMLHSNAFVCAGVNCAASPLSSRANPADPMITILPGIAGAITGHAYHDSAAPANALAGVVVHACPAIGPCRSAYTNSSGAYSILNLADGSYDMSTLDRDPYLANSFGTVVVSAGGTTGGQDIVMVAPLGATSGHTYLNAAGSGNELAGATVGACPTAGGACRTALSAPDGSYSIINLSDGAYDVTAVDPGSDTQATITSIVVAGAPTGSHDIVVVLLTGSISGHVYHDTIAPANAVGNAHVYACGSATCRNATTDGTGAYTLSQVPDGAYTVTVSPPAGFFGTSLSGVAVTGGGPTGGHDLVVQPPKTIDPSSGTTVNGSSSGVAGISSHAPATVTKIGPAGGTNGYSIAGSDGTVVLSGTLTETSLGYYEATPTVPPGTGAPLTFTITLVSGAGSESDSFNAVYIDPSGYVKTVGGAPIAGATVKLVRSDSPFGPFVQVPNNSTIMSPTNRTNPDVTAADGHFGWDVIAGYYQVRASKPGCVSAADPSAQVVT
jgi:hypothetical protein